MCIALIGGSLVAYEAWRIAPLLVLALLLMACGLGVVIAVETTQAIRTQREHWRDIEEQLKARNVDAEVEFLDDDEEVA
jgi:hypothetical protein